MERFVNSAMVLNCLGAKSKQSNLECGEGKIIGIMDLFCWLIYHNMLSSFQDCRRDGLIAQRLERNLALLSLVSRGTGNLSTFDSH